MGRERTRTLHHRDETRRLRSMVNHDMTGNLGGATQQGVAREQDTEGRYLGHGRVRLRGLEMPTTLLVPGWNTTCAATMPTPCKGFGWGKGRETER